MKKLLTLLFTILPLVLNAQTQLSIVTLKNGTQLKGVIKSINPSDAVILAIAGIETSIKMSEVALIEENSAPTSSTNVQNQVVKEKFPQTLQNNIKLVVTDQTSYPESYELALGDKKIKMILVRGGDMNMGYNGRHSKAMKSEPVHQVTVTSFYISSTALTCEQIGDLDAKFKGKGVLPAQVVNWDNAKYLTEEIASISGKPYRLPTEAEWEFAACCSKANDLFTDAMTNKKILYDWCSDLYGPLMDLTEIDPKGPDIGKGHVIRAFKSKRGKFDRSNAVELGSGELGFVRLVIKANEL